MQKLITVITVCYNAVNEIQRTVQSVQDQTYKDFEYLVIDGKSSDGTVDDLEKSRGEFEKVKIELKVVSEKDNGIYNAMNKGISLATGEWILFLNAGDIFYDRYTLERVYSELKADVKSEVIYGDVVLKKDGKYKIEKSGPIDEILYKMPFCHQASFTKKSLLKEYQFDENFRICADHDFFVRCYQANRIFRYIQFPIAVYEMFGASSDDSSYRFWKERFLIQEKDGYINDEEFHKKLTALKRHTNYLRFRQKIKKFVPQIYLDTRQQKIDDAAGWRAEYPVIKDEYNKTN